MKGRIVHLNKNRLLSLSIIFLLIAFLVPTLVAQDSSIILTVALPDWVTSNIEDDVFADFEAENPGVKVVVNSVGSDKIFFSSATYGVDEHLDAAAEYASSADVLFVNNYNLSVEGTRAGYFLDLSPLTTGDPTLNSDDFLPAAWSNFQWDRGIWGIPVTADMTLLIYDKAAFDKAGLSYPNEGWTIDDLANADEVLSERDADGNITKPGFYTFGNYNGLLIRSLLGRNLYDETVVPNTPLLNTPQVIALLDQWVAYQKDGLLGGAEPGEDFDINEVPIRIEQSFALYSFGTNTAQERAAALLPGGGAGLTSNGFAVSSGTQYPEQSYELAKFISTNIRLVNSFFSERPARESLIGAEDPDNIAFRPPYSAEDQAVIDQAFENGISYSDLRFTDYVNDVLTRMIQEDIDAQSGLQEAEIRAIENLQAASDRRATAVVIVPTPVPTPMLDAGQVSLNFNITAFTSPLPNRERWDQLIQEFTSSDPEVRQIVLNTDFGTSLTDIAASHDCFMLPYNATSSNDITSVLSLDPFIDADFEFDKNDLVGNVLTQLTRDNKIWAYPLNIQPQILWYDSNKFAEAGVPAPENGWTVDSFNDALRSLKINPDDPAPFVPQNSISASYILMLIAAYGGIPMDYRTTPPTINFTDPANVEAIRQVLDLAKDGYIKYQQLATLTGGFGGGEVASLIYNDTLNQLSFRFNTDSEGENVYRLTTFPAGTQYTPVAYDIGTAYISATSQNPEACYRWISKIAQNPDLFGAMPARRSQINDPSAASLQGEDLSAFYNTIDQQLQAPNTLEFPSPAGGGADASAVGNFIIQIWMNRAFDRYVLEDGNLDLELADAEMFAKAYGDCIAGIPPYDPASMTSIQDQINYFRQYLECATKVDPSLASFFPPLPE
jgi:ABC-type glycerol-3-phosphate transport system substrate-binding protein